MKLRSALRDGRRESEIEGKDYFFMSKEMFEEKTRRGELAEWEEIYGDYYGSLKAEIERARRAGKSILFDVDVGRHARRVLLQPGFFHHSLRETASDSDRGA